MIHPITQLRLSQYGGLWQLQCKPRGRQLLVQHVNIALKCHRNFLSFTFSSECEKKMMHWGKISWISRNAFLATCFLGSQDYPWADTDLHDLHQVLLWEGSIVNVHRQLRETESWLERSLPLKFSTSGEDAVLVWFMYDQMRSNYDNEYSKTGWSERFAGGWLATLG